MSTFRKTICLFTPAERRRGAAVLLLVVIMALVETAGVASVLPFLAVLGDPSIIETNPILKFLYDWLGFETTRDFLIALGTAAFGMIIISTAFRTLTTYAMNRFTQMRRHSISERLLETYLRQPYSFFLNRNSSELSKAVLSEVDQVVAAVLLPGFQTIAGAVVALALIGFLLIIDPMIAVGVGLAIGGMYFLIYLLVKRVLARIGEDRAIANTQRFLAAGEALAGIKNIKLLGRETAYLSRFRGPSTRFARHQATSNTLAEVPKFLIEAIGFGGILALALFLMATTGGIGSVLPILGVYAFAGYKLIPAAQRIYEGFARVRYGAAAVDELYADLRERTRQMEQRKSGGGVLVPKRELTLTRITYFYPGTRKPALNGIDLEIPVGSVVGFVGGTGAGKTSLVDVILGLLQPSEGLLCVDGTPVNQENLRAWQNALGYVPQDIFLADASIAENIALGVPQTKVDQEIVQECAKMAQIHDFIMSELPQQYATVVGERGVRLSGGQRQRIGIARALYTNPSVLVLDEATSALDTLTERAVMDAVNSIRNTRTIILVAHRLTTVRDCDRIFLLAQGRVEAEGSFNELRESSEQFAKMAGIGSG